MSLSRDCRDEAGSKPAPFGKSNTQRVRHPGTELSLESAADCECAELEIQGAGVFAV